MKRIKVFSLLIILLLNALCLISCGKQDKRFEDGDFLYRYVLDEMGDRGITIMSLSEQGKQKETIVIPTVIDDLPVKYFGDEFTYGYDGYLESENLKNIYIHSQIERYINTESFYKLKELTIYCGYSGYRLRKLSSDFSYDIKIVLSRDSFNKWDELSEQDLTKVNLFKQLDFANVIYYYNYYENETFFVDDCDGTIVNVIPPEPIRQGYKFSGWYKESECINKWDFEKDVVPSKEYDENGEYILKETKLYAKWEEE